MRQGALGTVPPLGARLGDKTPPKESERGNLPAGAGPEPREGGAGPGGRADAPRAGTRGRGRASSPSLSGRFPTPEALEQGPGQPPARKGGAAVGPDPPRPPPQGRRRRGRARFRSAAGTRRSREALPRSCGVPRRPGAGWGRCSSPLPARLELRRCAGRREPGPRAAGCSQVALQRCVCLAE